MYFVFHFIIILQSQICLMQFSIYCTVFSSINQFTLWFPKRIEPQTNSLVSQHPATLAQEVFHWAGLIVITLYLWCGHYNHITNNCLDPWQVLQHLWRGEGCIPYQRLGTATTQGHRAVCERRTVGWIHWPPWRRLSDLWIFGSQPGKWGEC